jgi:uncharacterized protein (TIGR03066 family)
MRLLRWTVVGCIAIGLAGCTSATTSNTKPSAATTKPEPKKEAGNGGPKKEASNQEKLLGTWVVAKSKGAPPGATLEFTKDNKMKMTVKQDGKEQSMDATYVVEGNKIITTMKLPPDGKEKKETATIEKLTDTELVTKDEKGETDEFKKK